MAKYNRPNGKLFGSSASNIGVFGSGQTGETPTTSTDPNAINTLGTHWEDGWNGAVVSQAPYTAPFVEDMNAVNYVNSYNSAYLLQRGIPEYSATEEYQKDSLCTYNSEIWMCKLDNTVGRTPAEGTYWHLQGEVPIMNANEILVGAVGGTPTVVDTNGQGDITASATGLNIKSGVIVNADVKSDAGIEESKLALDYSTSALEGTISGHISDSSNPHSVTKAQVLSGDLIVNADVDDSAGIKESKLDLDYATDTLNTNIGNVAGDLSTHTSNKNNPHETKISNLKDVTITNLQDGDVILYDLASDKYVNQQPPGGALSTLSDTTITTPIADKSLVQYNLGTGKWVNVSVPVPTLWVTSTSYSIGDFVFYGGRTYECKVAHTSSSVFESDFYTGKWDDGNIAGTIIHNLAFGKTPPYHYFDVTGSSAGAEISQTTYANLYAVIGDTYNTCYNYSSGSQYSAPASGNFRLPDFRNTFFKNSGSSTWALGHNAEHKHTTALDTATSLSHYHRYRKTNASNTDYMVATGGTTSSYVHWNSKPTNVSLDSNYRYFNFDASGDRQATSNITTTDSVTVPAIAMQNQGSGATPEPNNYGTRIFIKY